MSLREERPPIYTGSEEDQKTSGDPTAAAAAEDWAGYVRTKEVFSMTPSDECIDSLATVTYSKARY
jgi:hypothetical protein